MDIVSNLPFRLTFSDTHYNTIHCNCFSTDLFQVYQSEKVTAEIEENEEIWVMFDSEDENARFYLEALDAIPERYGIRVDEQDKIFKSPSKVSFPLFLNNGEFDALCVDKYVMKISCFGNVYHGILSIRPKQLEQSEWTIMKDELEQEMKDLGKQSLRRNGKMDTDDAISQEEWCILRFLHEQKDWILSAMQDILDHPKYKIETKYLRTVSQKPSKNNRKTIQYMLQKGECDRKLLIYKEISYDISENQFLKMVMGYCKKRLKPVLEKLSILLMDEQEYWDKEKLLQYWKSGKSICKFIAFLEEKKWYQEVTKHISGQLSRAVFMDDRYGYIYTVYHELQHPKSLDLDVIVHTAAWKPSSQLYEMWCYIKLCRSFEEKWERRSKELSHCFYYENGMPILEEGSYMEYGRGQLRVKLFYNPTLPRSSQITELEEQPYYMLNSHVQPDIVIHIYQDVTSTYLGSLVLECKYRKVRSFWNGSTMSSREQITSYWHGSKSHHFLGKIGELLDVRPVKCVYVLTPDEIWEEKMDEKIQLTSIRPGKNETIEQLYQKLEQEIEESTRLYDKFL